MMALFASKSPQSPPRGATKRLFAHIARHIWASTSSFLRRAGRIRTADLLTPSQAR
jgi:hypothetical protein